MSPAVFLSSLPIGSRRSDRPRATRERTLFLESLSSVVTAVPFGLKRRTQRAFGASLESPPTIASPVTLLPSTMTASFTGSTRKPSSVTNLPLTHTLPSAMRLSAPRLEATPQCERTLFSRSVRVASLVLISFSKATFGTSFGFGFLRAFALVSFSCSSFFCISAIHSSQSSSFPPFVLLISPNPLAYGVLSCHRLRMRFGLGPRRGRSWWR
mmetsp:Transcript_93/g.196  ORF Transcript_93/g.196 Transcript_93/m.196 type:complete len:212 (+) Transcript_93:794-1429(+)